MCVWTLNFRTNDLDVDIWNSRCLARFQVKLEDEGDRSKLDKFVLGSEHDAGKSQSQ